MEATENIPLEDIYFQINNQLFLDVLLMEIRGKTEILEKNKCQNWETIKSINTKKKELEALRQKNMDCVWMRR